MEELDLELFVQGGASVTGLKFLSSTHINRLSSNNVLLTNLPDSLMFTNNNGASRLTLDAALTVDSVLTVLESLSSLFVTEPEVFRRMVRGSDTREGWEGRGVSCDLYPPVPWMYGPTLVKHLKAVHFVGFSGNVSFNELGHRSSYQLEIMRTSLDRSITKIGVWNTDTEATFTVTSHKGDAYQPRDGPRIISTILQPPYFMKRKASPDDDHPPVGNKEYEGYCVDLAEMLSIEIGFNYTFKIARDGQFGAIGTDGKWNGIMGDLTRGDADLAVAPLTITSKRERVVDFSKPFVNLGVSIMIKRPEKIKPGVLSFMDPLSSLIWLCIMLAYLSVSVVLYIVTRLTSVQWATDLQNHSGAVASVIQENDFTLLNSLWFSLGGFMRQSCGLSPRSLPGRIAGSSWWFFTLIIISSYTANLAAFLTIERMRTPIDGADDLAKQTFIKYGTLEYGSTMDFFQTTRVSVYKRMWEAMKMWGPQVMVSSIKDGVTKVRREKGRYAFLLESTMNDYHNQREPCNTIRVGELLDYKGYGVATPLGSDLREQLGLAVLTLHENGALQKLHKKWWFDKGDCPPESESKGGGSSRNALTLSNVAGIFYILIAGLAISVFVTLLGFAFKVRLESIRIQKSMAEYISGQQVAACPIHDVSEVTRSSRKSLGNLDEDSELISLHANNSSSKLAVTLSTPISLI